MLRGHSQSFKEKHDGRIVNPCSKNGIEREPAAAKIIVQIFLLDRMRPLIGNLPCLVAHVEFRDIPLFGHFDPLFVGKLGETPKHAPAAIRAPVVKAIAASLLLSIANSEVGLSALCLNSL